MIGGCGKDDRNNGNIYSNIKIIMASKISKNENLRALVGGEEKGDVTRGNKTHRASKQLWHQR